VEAAGIEPASKDTAYIASTYLSSVLISQEKRPEAGFFSANRHVFLPDSEAVEKSGQPEPYVLHSVGRQMQNGCLI